MTLEKKIRMAEIATKLGVIEEKDWKTPKIISSKYRATVTRKAVTNAVKMGQNWVKNRNK